MTKEKILANFSETTQNTHLDPILDLINEIKIGFSLNLPIQIIGEDLDDFINDFEIFLEYDKNLNNFKLIDSLEVDELKCILGSYTFDKNIEFNNGILLDEKINGIIIKNLDENEQLLGFLQPLIKNEMYFFDKKVEKKLICFSKTTLKGFYNIFIEKNNEKNLLMFYNYSKKLISQKKFSQNDLNFINNRTFKELYEIIINDLNIFMKKSTGNLVERQEFYRKMMFKASNLEIESQEKIKNYLKQILILSDETDIEDPIFNFLAPTQALTTTLNNVKVCIEENIPVLLIGDTGTGKTTFIQELYKQATNNPEATIKVLNMSADTDIADFTGSYKIIDNKFKYVETTFLKAVKSGDWILLDEINLCYDNILKFLSAIVLKKSIFNFDKRENIKFHKNFRIFAAMNDKGKRKFEGKGFKKIYFDDFTKNKNDVNLVINKICKLSEPIKKKYSNFLNELISKKFSGIREFSISGRNLGRILKNSKNINDLTKLTDLIIFSKLDNIEELEAKFIFRKYFDLNDNIDLDLDFDNFDLNLKSNQKFIITENFKIIIYRVLLAIKFDIPILLYGDTSTGKTALVKFVSEVLSKCLYRINNHKNTEFSDYVGFYSSDHQNDKNKKVQKNEININLKFVPGTLVKALKDGDFLLLDELNLAPSDILESLNRLLDENKQLYVPELGLLTPNSSFRLFATQNENYKGRQILSTAFRNRFVEIFLKQKTENELVNILENFLPKKFVIKMLKVYEMLKRNRNIDVLMSLRELFKWQNRNCEDLEMLYLNGLMIVMERQRRLVDRKFISNTFKEVFSEINFSYENLIYKLKNDVINFEKLQLSDKSYFLTESHKKLVVLIEEAWKCRENVLLVGSTGIGKTKSIEILAKKYNQEVVTINFNSDFEASDFIGSFEILSSVSDFNTKDKDVCSDADSSNRSEVKIIFKDGPIIEAMKKGKILLLDEINLCPDSVIERLNSLLDSNTMFLTETNEQITSHPMLKIIATMNPGNDFGKKELSIALKNRFTEIYFEFKEYENICEMFNVDFYLIQKILKELNFKADLKNLLTIRKVEKVSKFVSMYKKIIKDERKLYFEALLVSNVLEEKNDSALIKSVYFANSVDLNYINDNFRVDDNLIGIHPYYIRNINEDNNRNSDIYSNTMNNNINIENYNLKTQNFYKLLRAYQLNMPILLKGNPGCGKTSIVVSLAKALKKNYVRINLSDQTEFIDLIGTLCPSNNFKFKESQFIKIVRNGGIVILDEINLCQQSILEGLNSLLDYRTSITVNGENIKSKAFIFATMNPCNDINGRKMLPQSFLDRFVSVNFEYTDDELKNILGKSYKFLNTNNKNSNNKNSNRNGLRNALRIEQLGENCNKNIQPFYSIILNSEEIIQKQINYKLPKNYELYQPFLDTTLDDKILLNKEINFSKILLGNTKLFISNKYVLTRKNLSSIETLFRCLYLKIPVIVKGFGVNKILEMFEKNSFYCHKETEISDFVGEFISNNFNYCNNQEIDKSNKNSKEIFTWKDSNFIENLKSKKILVIKNPDKVQKSTFDRLNSIFDSRTFYVSEYKHEEINIECRFILVVDEIINLSPALKDRCVCLEFYEDFSGIDNLKLFDSKNFSDSNQNIAEEFNLLVNNKIYKPFKSLNVKNNSLDIFIKTLIVNKNLIKMNKYETKINLIKDRKLRNIESKNKIYEENNTNRIILEKIDFMTNTTDLNLVKKERKAPKALKLYLSLKQKNSQLKIIENLLKQKIYNLKLKKVDLIKLMFNIEDSYTNLFDDLEFKDYYSNLKTVIENSYNKFEEFKNNSFILDLKDEEINKIISKIKTKDPIQLLIEYLNTDNLPKYAIKYIEQIYKYSELGEDKCDKLVEFIELRNKEKNILNEVDIIKDREFYIFRSFLDELQDNIAKIISNSNIKDKKNIEKILDSLKNLYDANINNFNDIIFFFKAIVYTKIDSLIFKQNPMISIIPQKSINDTNKIIKECKKIDEGIINNSYCKILYCKLFNIKVDDNFINQFAIECSIQGLYVEEKDLDSTIIQISDKINSNLRFINNSKNKDTENKDIDKESNRNNFDINNIFEFKNPNPLIQNYKPLFYFLSLNDKQYSLKIIENFILSSNLMDFYSKLIFINKLLLKNSTDLKTDYKYRLYNFSIIYYNLIDGIEFIINNYNNKVKFSSNLNNYTELEILKAPCSSFISNSNIDHRKYLKNFPNSKCTRECVKYSKHYNLDDNETFKNQCCCIFWYNFRSINKNKIPRFSNKKSIKIFFIREVNDKDLYSDRELLLGILVLNFIKHKKFESLVLQAIEYPFIPFIVYVIELFNIEMVEENENEKDLDKKNMNNLDGQSAESESNCESNNQLEEENEGKVDEMEDSKKVDINEIEKIEKEKETEIDDSKEAKIEEDKEKNENSQELDDSEEVLDKIENEELGEETNLDNSSFEELESERENLSEYSKELELESNDSYDSIQENSESGDKYINSSEDKNSKEDFNSTEEMNSDENILSEDVNSSDGLNNANNNNLFNNYVFNEENLTISKDPNIKNLESINSENPEVPNLEEDESGSQELETQINNSKNSKPTKFPESKKSLTLNNFQTLNDLTSLLKPILVNNLNSKYVGDYKSGKKLNLKKIIPFIASNYTKDKIWMKKLRKEKSDYVFRIFIDDTESMLEKGYTNDVKSVVENFKKSLKNLGIEYKIYKFTDSVTEIKSLYELSFQGMNTKLDWINSEEFKTSLNVIFTDGIFQNSNSLSNKNFLVVILDKDVCEVDCVKIIGDDVVRFKYLESLKVRYCLVGGGDDMESVFVGAVSELFREFNEDVI